MRILTTTIAAATLAGLGLAGVSVLRPATADAATTVGAVAEASADTAPTPPALGWRWFSRLTPDQRACLDKASITRPIGPLTKEERAKVQADLRAAAQGCGITVPTGERRARVKAWWDGLSPDQQSCLKQANLTRPIGPLSKAERQKLRSDVAAAAKGCNVTLPK
jgi:mRNA-degrading endonuclease toxin of MazEF toxin-antitoxin module